MAFSGKKSLATILGQFTKTNDELNAFLQQTQGDIDSTSTQIQDLEAKQEQFKADMERAVNAQNIIGAIIGG